MVKKTLFGRVESREQKDHRKGTRKYIERNRWSIIIIGFLNNMTDYLLYHLIFTLIFFLL